MMVNRLLISTRLLRACAALMILLSGCNSEGTTSSSPNDAPEDFWSALSAQQDYTYFNTLREMSEISDVSIIGQIVDIKDGRVLGGKKGEPGTVSTFLLEVEVLEVVRGELAKDSKKRVDVEIISSGDFSAEELDDLIPGQDVLLLLQDMAKQPQPEKFDDSGVDRDPDKKLYTIPTPKALFIETSDDVITPLDPPPGPYDDSIEATTLQELAEEIRSF